MCAPAQSAREIFVSVHTAVSGTRQHNAFPAAISQTYCSSSRPGTSSIPGRDLAGVVDAIGPDAGTNMRSIAMVKAWDLNHSGHTGDKIILDVSH
jgi:hypothetical protein